MTHGCYYRGCKEIVSMSDRYCERHQGIYDRQKAATARRNSEAAVERQERKRTQKMYDELRLP